MNRRLGLFLLTLIVVTASRLTASAETPYERDQREMLEKERREHGLSPQVEQAH